MEIMPGIIKGTKNESWLTRSWALAENLLLSISLLDEHSVIPTLLNTYYYTHRLVHCHFSSVKLIFALLGNQHKTPQLVREKRKTDCGVLSPALNIYVTFTPKAGRSPWNRE